jgi:hypothetical protein
MKPERDGEDFFLGGLSPLLSEQLQTNPPGEKGKIR